MLPPPPLLLLGCGYTLSRVAQLALAEGRSVIATAREPARLRSLADAGATVLRLDVDEPATLAAAAEAVPSGVQAVHSVPVLRTERGLVDPTPRLLRALAGKIARLAYISSTGVYGKQADVDETTPTAPATPLQQLRVDAEDAVRSTVSSSVVLRPAAIYGPGRGVHVMLRAGRYRLAGDGSNVVSRIHVADLADIVYAAVNADVETAWPVADDDPATAAEVARFVTDLLGLPAPSRVSMDDVHETMRFTRRVDGRALRDRLGVKLRYPSFREGIPAAIAQERDSAGETP